MQGYITSVTHFCGTHVDEIVSELIRLYPQAEAAQIQSWHTLILDAQGTSAIHRLPADTTIAIEFSLPTDGMAIDLVIAGCDSQNQKVAFLLESKQWNDVYINRLSFSAYREMGQELHPQIQVSRHKMSFCDYLDIGPSYQAYPYVFIKNASSQGIDRIL